MSNELERVEKLAQLEAVIARALARDRQGFGSCNFPRDLAEEIAALTPTPQVVEGMTVADLRFLLDGADDSWPVMVNIGAAEHDTPIDTAARSGEYGVSLHVPTPDVDVIAEVRAWSEYHANRLSRMVDHMMNVGYRRNLTDITALTSAMAFLDREAGR